MSARKTIAILPDRWWRTDGETGRGQDEHAIKSFDVIFGKKNVMRTKMLEVSLLVGVGTVLRLERDAWSLVE